MKQCVGKLATVLMALLGPAMTCAQRAPASAQAPWQGPTSLHLPPRPSAVIVPDPNKVYTLPELVNLAEQNNPETRVAWENAKVRAAELGISKSALYPTVAAMATGEAARVNLFVSPDYYRQTSYTFSPAVELEYTIFDFGRRSAEIAISRNNLLSANFLFNDTHRKVIFDVMAAYYRVLNTKGQEDAAEANLKNAQTDQASAESRLELGLATLPDVLEARSAAAQADYDLQAALGASEIARGDLNTALGVSPATPLQVESIQSLKIPDELTSTVESSIDKALDQRPDLMQRVAELRAAKAEVKEAKSAYLPTLTVGGSAGLAKSVTQQNQGPDVYSNNQENWDARLSLKWTLFDGFAREQRLARARAAQKQASADIDAMRDQVENEVWSAYSTARTALRQQKAAAALLAAATSSYNAATQSYSFGVRSQIDVVSAQKTLAAARTADVSARTNLLTGIAALAFQTGDLLHSKGP
jgi:outer membrane protein